MTQRKFRDTTRGGYPVRNIRPNETDGPFVLQAEIWTRRSDGLGKYPFGWHTMLFTKNGAFRVNSSDSLFDLMEVQE